MATYTIKILNNSQASKSYVAFLAQPTVTSNGGATPVYTNAWATFENVTDGSWDSVVYTETTYAYWAQPSTTLSPGATMDSGGSKPVNTATKDTVAFTNTGATGFASVASPGTAQNGSFSIATTTDFMPQNNFVFGLASDNGTPIPSPVATFSALPNEVYNVTPVVKFYVADGLYQAGAIIDYSGVSNVAAAIDFTGLPQTTATVTQAANGSFSVVYS
jgi:hypothetical protein